MALYRAFGTISTPTSTGLQTYTCTDILTAATFQPKLVIFRSADRADNSALGNADLVAMKGATDGTRQWVVGARQGDNQGTTQGVTGRFDTACISIPGVNSTTAKVVGAIDSFNAADFKINFTTVDASAHTVFWEALGGDEIESVRVDTLDSGTGTTDLATTSPGFTPDLVEFTTGRRVAAATDAYSTGASVNYGVGVTNFASQWATAWLTEDGQAAADDYEVYHTSWCCAALTDNGSVYFSADYVSADVNGFTIDRITNTGSMALHYIALKVTNGVAVGTDTQKASTGTQAKTGLGFKPQFLVANLNRANDSATPGNYAYFCDGAAIGSDTAYQHVVAGGSTDAADPTTTSAHARTGKILCAIANDNASLLSEAGLSSFDNDGYTVDWTTADASTRPWSWWALEGSPGTAGTSAQTAPGPEQAGSGWVEGVGTGAQTAANAEQAGVGALRYGATGSSTIGRATQAGSAWAEAVGTGAQEAANADQAGVAAEKFVGNGASAANNAEQAGLGSAAFEGVGASLGAGAEQAGTGAVEPSGQGAQTGANADQAGAALEEMVGVGAQTGANAEQAGAGVMQPEGTGASLGPNAEQQGASALEFIGSGANEASSATQAGAAAESFTGSGTQTGASPQQSGQAVETITGAGASEAPGATQQGSAFERIALTGDQILAATRQEGFGFEVFEGAGDQSAGSADQAGVGFLQPEGVGGQTSPAAEQAGIGLGASQVNEPGSMEGSETAATMAGAAAGPSMAGVAVAASMVGTGIHTGNMRGTQIGAGSVRGSD